MGSEQNKQLVEQRQHVWNTGELDRVEELFADDYIGHMPDEDRRGVESVKGYMRGIRTAFPDLEVSYETVIAEDDMVAVFVRLTGTHKGRLGELEPTGRRVDLNASFFSRIEDGQFTEEWILTDLAGMTSQLGERVSSNLTGAGSGERSDVGRH